MRNFDKRCNMAVKDVMEMSVRYLIWRHMETVAPLYMDRFVPKILLEGESILSILNIKEQASKHCSTID